tara:strand:- start:725 stop:1084 length:360 start_codon:yes stop_codon:yes gene_type:complete
LGNVDQLLTKLKKAIRLAGDTHTLEDVVDAIKAGKMQAFWNDDAIVVTQVCKTPRLVFVNIFLVAGAMDGVLSLVPQVREWAEKNGYTRVRACVRPGFEPLLKKMGWQRRQILMEFDNG